ncbi:MAG: tetratricopeptide repeat protein [Cyanobacteria bacterium REEB67]|nr:tetratricopeptide repeat protein [Cyanobacteria bacterium REEB67]
MPSVDLAEEGDAPLGLTFKPSKAQSPALQHMLDQLNEVLEHKHKEQAKLLIHEYRLHHPADQAFFGNVALHYSTHHHYHDAIDFVSQGLAHYPQSLPLSILQAQIYLTAGDIAGAEKQIQHCITLDPQFEMLHVELAHLYMRQHRLVEALHEIEKAIALDNDKVSTWQTRGVLLAALHRNEEAVAALNKAVQLTKPLAITFDLRKVRGPLLETLGRYDEAIKDYQYLLKINPEMRFRAATHIGYCYLGLKEPQKALVYFNQEIKKKPNYLRAHKGRLQCYEALGEHDAVVHEAKIVAGLHEDWEADR